MNVLGSVVGAAALIIQGIAYSQTDTLDIAVEDAASPWSQADGTGYANDVVVSAFKAGGVAVRFLVMPYARCKKMVIRGEVAAAFSMSPSPEFDGLVTFSVKPLFSCNSDFFCRVNSLMEVRRKEDLPRHTVIGTVIGYEYPSVFEELRHSGVIVPEESPSEELNLRKLVLGRIDFALLNCNALKSPELVAEWAGVQGKVRFAFRCGILNSYIGFSNKHPKGMRALRKFNSGFTRISSNGVLRSIERRWSKLLKAHKIHVR